MTRTLPSQAMGTSVLAATRFARRLHLHPEPDPAPEVAGGDTRGGGVAGKGVRGGGGGADILRLGTQAARSPAARSPDQLSGALRQQTNKSVSFTARHPQPLSGNGVSPFLGSPLGLGCMVYGLGVVVSGAFIKNLLHNHSVNIK
jgi:hypothetical protein